MTVLGFPLYRLKPNITTWFCNKQPCTTLLKLVEYNFLKKIRVLTYPRTFNKSCHDFIWFLLCAFFRFETDNGISRQENGEVKEAFDEDKKPHPVVVVRGSWTYTDPEGKVETINYFADEYGFRAEGPSIPKGPASRR